MSQKVVMLVMILYFLNIPSDNGFNPQSQRPVHRLHRLHNGNQIGHVSREGEEDVNKDANGHHPDTDFAIDLTRL